MAIPLIEVNPEHLVARLGGWRDGSGPLYLRMAEALRALAHSGGVTPGTRLPSERALASALCVSRNTVTAAYTLLRDDGWLVGPRGAAPRVGAAVRLSAAEDGPTDPLASLFSSDESPVFDLTVASPGPAPAVIDALANIKALWPGQAVHDRGYYPGGHPVLLDAIAHKLRREGIPAHPDEVVVTNGAQQALALVAETLRRARRPVALEAVTYPGIIDALGRRGRGSLVALPVNDTGLRTDIAARLIRATSPGAVYVTTFQNPTGQAIEPRDVKDLLRAAEATGTALVEDRVLADLPLDGRDPPTPLAARRTGATVVTIGSLSKVFWGGLRIGWIHTNRTLAVHLRARRRALDLGSPAPMQYIAAWLLQHDDEETRGWRIRQLQGSLDALTDAINAADIAWRFRRPAGGPNLWVRLPKSTAQSYASGAARRGVPVAAGNTFAITPGMAADMIRIPFYLPPQQMTTAVATLVAAWRNDHRAGRTDRRMPSPRS